MNLYAIYSFRKVVRGTSQSSDCSTKNDKKNMYAKSCLNSRQDPDRCHASPDYPTELFSTIMGTALRLPDNLFKENANTEADSDLIIIQICASLPNGEAA